MAGKDKYHPLQNYVNPDQNGNDQQEQPEQHVVEESLSSTSCGKSCWSALFVYIFFDWPWEMVMKMNSTDHEAEDHQNLSIRWLIGKCIFKSLHVFLIIIGAFSQLIICFSRLNPYSHWVQESNMSINTNSTTHYCQLKCDIDKHFITAFIFPDAIIILLSFMKLLVELLDCPCHQELCCQRVKNYLNNNAEKSHLYMLVKSLKSPIDFKYAKRSIAYIFLSLIASGIYVYAFGIARKHVVIQSPIITSRNNDDIWRWIGIVCSILGFLAIDLLYIQVIMWYANKCYLLISCLNSIKISPQKQQGQEPGHQDQGPRHQDQGSRHQDQGPGHQEQGPGHQEQGPRHQDQGPRHQDQGPGHQEQGPGHQEQGPGHQDQEPGHQDQGPRHQDQLVFIQEQKKKIEDIVTFLRQFNKNNVAIGIVIVIAGFSAISCIINLLNTTNCPLNDKAIMQLLQVGAVILRLLLWTFITLFPFYKVADVNTALREFSFKLAMYSPEAEKVSKGLKYFSPEARLLGISVQPWLPNMIVFTLFFTIMLGSGIVAYFHLL